MNTLLEAIQQLNKEQVDEAKILNYPEGDEPLLTQMQIDDYDENGDVIEAVQAFFTAIDNKKEDDAEAEAMKKAAEQRIIDFFVKTIKAKPKDFEGRKFTDYRSMNKFVKKLNVEQVVEFRKLIDNLYDDLTFEKRPTATAPLMYGTIAKNDGHLDISDYANQNRYKYATPEKEMTPEEQHDADLLNDQKALDKYYRDKANKQDYIRNHTNLFNYDTAQDIENNFNCKYYSVFRVYPNMYKFNQMQDLDTNSRHSEMNNLKDTIDLKLSDLCERIPGIKLEFKDMMESRMRMIFVYKISAPDADKIKEAFKLIYYDMIKNHLFELDQYYYNDTYISLNIMTNESLKEAKEDKNEEKSFFFFNKDQVEVKEELNEDVNSSMPAPYLDETTIRNFATTVKGGQFFKIGYLKECRIKSQYRGGRKSSPDDPLVRVFKATEYYGSIGTQPTKYAQTQDYLARGGELENPRWLADWEVRDRIGNTRAGNVALAITPRVERNNHFHVDFRYFISYNNEDLTPCTKDEALNYVSAPSELDILDYAPEGSRQRFPLLFNYIYMLGNNGHSIM